MINEMVKDLVSINDEIRKKTPSLSESQITQIRNYLTKINLSVDLMTAQKEEVYKLTNEIKNILNSNDENEDR